MPVDKQRFEPWFWPAALGLVLGTICGFAFFGVGIGFPPIPARWIELLAAVGTFLGALAACVAAWFSWRSARTAERSVAAQLRHLEDQRFQMLKDEIPMIRLRLDGVYTRPTPPVVVLNFDGPVSSPHVRASWHADRCFAPGDRLATLFLGEGVFFEDFEMRPRDVRRIELSEQIRTAIDSLHPTVAIGLPSVDRFRFEFAAEAPLLLGQNGNGQSLELLVFWTDKGWIVWWILFGDPRSLMNPAADLPVLERMGHPWGNWVGPLFPDLPPPGFPPAHSRRPDTAE